MPVELFFSQWPNIFQTTLKQPEQFNAELVEKIKTSLVNGTVPLHFVFTENGQTIRLKTKQKISVSADMIAELEKQNVDVQLTL